MKRNETNGEGQLGEFPGTIYLNFELLEKLEREGLAMPRGDETIFHKVATTDEGDIYFNIESENSQVYGMESQQERYRYTQRFQAIDKVGESTYVRFTSRGPTAASASRVFKVLVTIVLWTFDSSAKTNS